MRLCSWLTSFNEDIAIRADDCPPSSSENFPPDATFPCRRGLADEDRGLGLEEVLGDFDALFTPLSNLLVLGDVELTLEVSFCALYLLSIFIIMSRSSCGTHKQRWE